MSSTQGTRPTFVAIDETAPPAGPVLVGFDGSRSGDDVIVLAQLHTDRPATITIVHEPEAPLDRDAVLRARAARRRRGER